MLYVCCVVLSVHDISLFSTSSCAHLLASTEAIRLASRLLSSPHCCNLGSLILARLVVVVVVVVVVVRSTRSFFCFLLGLAFCRGMCTISLLPSTSRSRARFLIRCSGGACNGGLGLGFCKDGIGLNSEGEIGKQVVGRGTSKQVVGAIRGLGGGTGTEGFCLHGGSTSDIQLRGTSAPTFPPTSGLVHLKRGITVWGMRGRANGKRGGTITGTCTGTIESKH